MTDFSANRKKNDLGVLQLNLDMSKFRCKMILIFKLSLFTKSTAIIIENLIFYKSN